MFKKKWLVLFTLLLTVCIVAACGGKNASDGGSSPSPSSAASPSSAPPAVTKDPVDLNFMYGSTIADFDKKYADQVKKKYPNFNLKLLNIPPGQTLDQVMTANTPIDIIYTTVSGIQPYTDAGLTSDISDLVKKYNIDLNQFEPATLDMLRKAADGKLIGVPYKNINLALFYNKDLFDKFGVPYPKDGMTWDEVYDIAKKMTRVEGGVTYRGFAGDLSSMLLENQYSLNIVDPKTNKAAYATDDRWKKVIETYASMFTVPNYGATADMLTRANQLNLFKKEATVAMWVADNSGFPQQQENPNLKWDVVTAPEFSDARGVGQQPLPVYMIPASSSKHRDEAFLAAVQLASEEVQTWNAKELLSSTVLKKQQVKDAFAQGNPYFQGKNMVPFNPTKFAPPVTLMRYTNDGRTPLNEALNQVILGKKDVNTALRDAADAANKAIETKMAAKK